MDELRSDCSEKHGCFATVAVALLEEEASTKYILRREAGGYGTRYRRFAGAGHAAQLQDAFTAGVFDPPVDLGEKVNAGIGMASGVVLVGLRVEGRAYYNRELRQIDLTADIENLGAGF